MTPLSERMRGLIVTPSRGQPTITRGSRPVTRQEACVAVLVAPADASAAAAAVALGLIRRTKRSCALVVSWGCGDEDPLPMGALPAATRLARRLCESGLVAVAAGRLVRVALTGTSSAAISDWRALAGEGVPMAFAVAGPRCVELDRELQGVERIVVAGAESPAGLVSAAEADAQTIGPHVRTASMPLGVVTRGLLTLGYGASPPIRRAIDNALG